jgi:HSP20 family protein
MAVIRWNPWNISSILEDDWTLPTIPGLSRLGQGLNIYETEDALIAEAALPGIPEDKIDITVEDGIVRITGSVDQTQEVKDQRRYFMSSMASSYNYSFRLPEGIIADVEPNAEVDNGVLTLTFKKVEKAAPKKVRVVKKAKEQAAAK